MFRSFYITALRHLFRDKYYASINILGLAVGIACCLILGLYLKAEFSYDRHNLLYERIYRVSFNTTREEITQSSSETSSILGPLLARDYPEVEAFVRLKNASRSPMLLRTEDKAIYWDTVMYADENVFDVFTHQIISGDPASALSDPLSIAISESFAQAYFGDKDPLGLFLSTDTTSYRISLVFADLPKESHLKYNALLPFAAYQSTLLDSSSISRALFLIDSHTYLLLPDNYSVSEFSFIADAIWEQYMSPFAEQSAFLSKWNYYIEPLADIHLRSNESIDNPRPRILYLYTLLALGALVLLIVIINYMNLATARSLKRAKEVGIRKTLGADKKQLILRFLSESLILSIIAIPIALILVECILVLTPLNSLLGVSISFTDLLTPTTMFVTIFSAILLGVTSGVYPAFFMSSFPVHLSLMNVHFSNRSTFVIRHWLVLIQFVISIGVIACALLMYSQIRYVHNKPLGFDKENRLVLSLPNRSIVDNIPVLKRALLQNANILGVTTTGDLLGRDRRSSSYMDSEGVETKFFYSSNDENYLQVMGMELVAGRNFNTGQLAEIHNAAIVNETAVKNMDWGEPSEALGKTIDQLVRGSSEPYQVVGVVRDFHFQGMGYEVGPMALYFDQSALRSRYLVLNISESDIPETINFIQESWQEFNPDYPFQFQFLEDSLDELYSSNERQMSFVGLIAGLCVFLSSLGLFGLAAYTTEQRAKELGIRKILGASSLQLLFMLFKNICQIIVAAGLVAFPISFWAFGRWLQQFVYRTEINMLLFIVALAVCVIIAFITMTLQSWKTSRLNPVESLRYE